MKNLKKTLIAGVSLLVISTSMQTLAQEERVRTLKTFTPAGSCEISDREFEIGSKARLMSDGSIYGGGSASGRTTVVCNLSASDSALGGFLRVGVRYYDHFKDYGNGKSMCSIVYTGKWGEYITTTYRYHYYRKSDTTIFRSPYAGNYQTAVLKCQLTPMDRLYSFTTFDYR